MPMVWRSPVRARSISGRSPRCEAYERAVQQAMEHEEVDALIAMFACVGDCDPQLVGRGIRRGVLRAERKTGIAKPALLCLMGAAGCGRVRRREPLHAVCSPPTDFPNRPP